MTIMNKIGKYCRDYRVNTLKLTRKEVAPHINPQTLAQFESGNSTNIKHFISYFNASKNQELQLEFLLGINKLLRELNNHE